MITQLLFNIKDAFNGFKIKKHYNEISLFYKQHQLINHSQLEILLKHTIDNVSKYKGLSPEIVDFPVLNKTIIKGDQTLFLAYNYLGKKRVTMTTSGSTGTPFTVYQDLNKKARNHADTLYFGELAGYKLGNRLAYLKIWVKQKMSSPILYKIQNIVPIDVISLNDSLIKSIINQMEKGKNIWGILGYVSALEQIIQYLEKNSKNQINAKIDSVITMSEGLSPETKTRLEKIFNCPVVSRYSNLENGIIAQQETNGKQEFLINTASYYVEIFSLEKDKVLPFGQLGRIVVTDLFNFAMPMIRYDTGDLGIMKQEGHQLYLESVQGRKLDVLYDTKGQMVSSYIMYKNMWQYTEINQYQLIQTHQKDYTFKINCPDAFLKEQQLISEFKSFLGEDANFKVEYVNEIPLLDSGKRRKTVNLYYK